MKQLVKPRYRIVGAMTRFDERENVHARYELEPGSPDWKTFYAEHPAWEEKDLAAKALPGLGKVGHGWDLPMHASQTRILAMLGREDAVDGPVSPAVQPMDPARASQKIKGFARHLGADLVRIGPLNPAHVYTHVGKTKQCPDKVRGAPISLPHKHAVVFAAGVRPALLKTGPVLPMFLEIMRVYTILAKVSVAVAGYIRGLGYPARAHNLRNYLVLCVPVAIDAGMGELSRMGTMITKELGPALKLSVVTTDLPLPHDPPVDIGVDEFCQDCRICAKNCPSGAIPYGGKDVVRGVEKWRINPEACFRVWCESGTDCGVCLASCPWTKPKTPFHSLCREVASRKHKAGWWMSRAEELAYGRFRPQPAPEWLEAPDLSLLAERYKRLRSG